MGREPKQAQSGFSRVDSLGYKFYRISHLFGRALDARLAKHGVSVGQFRLLLVLWEGEQLTQAEIARYLDIEQPTVANTLKRMERDGLITMTAHPEDGRRQRIALTRRGQNLKPVLTAEAQLINDVVVDGLSASDVTRLHEFLDHLANALSEPDA